MTPEEFWKRDTQRRITSMEKQYKYLKVDMRLLQKQIRQLLPYAEAVAQHEEELNDLWTVIDHLDPVANAPPKRRRSDYEPPADSK